MVTHSQVVLEIDSKARSFIIIVLLLVTIIIN